MYISKKTEKAYLFIHNIDGYKCSLWIPKSILLRLEDNKVAIPPWFLKKHEWIREKCLCPLEHRQVINTGSSDSYTYKCTRCGKIGWEE